MGDDEPNPYTVLQVDPTADQEVLRAAYRVLARRYHPDTGHPDARQRMVALNRAWELVGDPTRRTATDRQLRNRGAGDSCGAHPPGAGDGPHGSGSAGAGSDDHERGAGARRTQDWPTPLWMQRNGRRRVTNHWGAGTAGPPPGRPSGSIIDFGIYRGWSLGEVARSDPGYLTWLADRPEGRPFAAEIAAMRSASQPAPRQGFGRRLFGRG